MVFIETLLCFFGFHNWIDCDECEITNNISIMQICIKCNKIKSEV